MKRLVVVGVVVVLAGFMAATAAATPSATCSPESCGTWQPGPVTITWSDENPAGDPSLCPSTVSGDSPGTDGTEVDCDDGDGDGQVTIHVKVDNTGPTDVAGLLRPPDSNGWYNQPVGLSMLQTTDQLSGVDFASCTQATYSGPDSASAQLSGDCSDTAGNLGDTVSTPDFQYDATPPVIQTETLNRAPDSNGWYNHPVGLVLTALDNLSGVASCTSPSYSGPDGASVQLGGTCADVAGNTSAPGAATFAYDSTAPSVNVSPDRPPDHNGWYNHPVSFTVTGSDAISQVASCAGNSTYSGPQSSGAAAVGQCTDNAGNVGFGARAFRYDASRPSAADVQVTPGNRRVDVSWITPSDATAVTLVRAQQGSSAAPKVIYSGSRSSFVDTRLKNGVKYSYTVADIDQAGNSTTKTVRAIPTASSLRPFVGSVVSSPPLLTWKKIKGARYYNIQLWFGKTKVLSKWPNTNSFQVAAKWHFRGKTINLLPGHYRWYVWPGFGRLSQHRYGDRIGRSSFRVSG